MALSSLSLKGKKVSDVISPWQVFQPFKCVWEREGVCLEKGGFLLSNYFFHSELQMFGNIT